MTRAGWSQYNGTGLCDLGSPYISVNCGAAMNTNVAYDEQGRPLVSTAADGTTTRHLYGVTTEGSLTATYDDDLDANRHRTQTRFDPLDVQLRFTKLMAIAPVTVGIRALLVVEVLPPTGSLRALPTTTSTRRNRLTSVSDNSSNTTAIAYDARGLKTACQTPTWETGFTRMTA